FLNCFFVLSDASPATMTNCAFPSFTAFSTENSPLTDFLALVANPNKDNTLFCTKRIQLLSQCIIYFFGNCYFQRSFQTFCLLCLFQTDYISANICPSTIFLSSGI